MGKCKKRTLYKTNTSYYMTREEAVNNIFKTLGTKTSSDDYKKVKDIISLFGLTAEELSEAGVSFENLKALEALID